MIRLLGYLAAALALLGLVYVVFSRAGIHPLINLTPPQGVRITVERIHDSTEAYDAQAQYPQVGIPSIDSQIKKVVDDAVSEFKTLPQNPHGSATPQNSFFGSFDSVYVGPDIVSADLVLYQYTGGAHGMTVEQGLNFERATGRMLTLDDALKLSGLTLEELSKQSAEKLKVQISDWFQFPEGVSADPKNFNSFIVSGDSVTFIFQQYQVAAYAAGIQKVSFPRTK